MLCLCADADRGKASSQTLHWSNALSFGKLSPFQQSGCFPSPKWFIPAHTSSTSQVINLWRHSTDKSISLPYSIKMSKRFCLTASQNTLDVCAQSTNNRLFNHKLHSLTCRLCQVASQLQTKSWPSCLHMTATFHLRKLQTRTIFHCDRQLLWLKIWTESYGVIQTCKNIPEYCIPLPKSTCFYRGLRHTMAASDSDCACAKLQKLGTQAPTTYLTGAIAPKWAQLNIILDFSYKLCGGSTKSCLVFTTN